MQQEVELELGSSEAGDSGGVEHQGPADRAGRGRDRRPEEQATRRRTEVDREPTATRELRGAGGDAATSSAARTRGRGPRVKGPGSGDE